MRHGRLREVGLEIFVVHSRMFWWQSPIFFSPYIGHWESGAVGRNDSAQVRTRVSGARYPSMTFDDLVLTVPNLRGSTSPLMVREVSITQTVDTVSETGGVSSRAVPTA